MSNSFNPDWRIQAYSTLVHDLPPAYPGGPAFEAGSQVFLTHLAKTTKHGELSFITPSAIALGLNVAFTAANNATEQMKALNWSSFQGPNGPVRSIQPNQNDMLYSFFESCLTAVTFSFQSIETFCNHSLGTNWSKPIEVKRQKVIKILKSCKEAERQLSTEEKLKHFLPDMYGVGTPCGKAIWERFVNLKEARDSCVHMKYDEISGVVKLADQDQDQASLFFHFLDNDPISFPRSAKEIIEYFYQTRERPPWLLNFPH